MLDAHPVRVCIFFFFADLARLKAQLAKQKQPMPLMKDGKELPSPNSVISSSMKVLLKGDYCVKSLKQGVIQQIIISTKDDAKVLVDKFKLQFEAGKAVPCNSQATYVFDMEGHVALAKWLKLM